MVTDFTWLRTMFAVARWSHRETRPHCIADIGKALGKLLGMGGNREKVKSMTVKFITPRGASLGLIRSSTKPKE